MQRKIKLSKELYNYLISVISDDKVLQEKIESNSIVEDDAIITVDVDTKIELMEYVEDLQLEIGFENEDYLNEDGKKLQDIYDEIYYQTN